MQVTIRFENGLRVEALLLAASAERMRVALPARGDALDLRLADGRWSLESGPAIEIEALIAFPPAARSASWRDLPVQDAHAGAHTPVIH